MLFTDYVRNRTFVLQQFNLPELARDLGKSDVVESM